MRVLHIIQRYPPAIGGSERWCQDLCHYLVQKGIVTRVATINLNNPDAFFKWLPEERYSIFGRYDLDQGVFVTRYELSGFSYKTPFMRTVVFFLYFTRLYKSTLGSIFEHSPHSLQMYGQIASEIRGADIVHLHTLPYFHNIVGWILAKIFKKKIVITPHFHPGHEHYEHKIFYFLMKRCGAVITVSRFEKEYLVEHGIPESKIFITANSTSREFLATKEECESYKNNLFKKYNISENAKKIIFVGRKQINKGIYVLIEAATELAKETKEEICVFLVGPDTIQYSGIDSAVEKPANLKLIDFGVVSDSEKENLLQISDVLVLASKFEAFGIVFLEAWKFGKPVIGTDAGPSLEVIRGAGLHVKFGDASDLKEKLKLILFDSKLAKELGEVGRKKLDKEYSCENIGKIVLSAYHKVRKSKKRLAIVNNEFPPYEGVSGSGIVAYQQSRIFERIGFDVKIFTGERNESIKRFQVRKEKHPLEITRINLHEKDYDYNFVEHDKKQIKREFCKFLYENSPDIVHFHNIYAFGPSIIETCCDLHIPCLITLHDYNFICFKNVLRTDDLVVCEKKELECRYCFDRTFQKDESILTLSERNRYYMQYLNLSQMVISPSRYLINRFVDCGLSPEKAVFINNGIDLSRFKHMKKSFSGKIRFAFIGQVIEHKGIEELLYSVSQLNPEEKRRASFIVVGTGEKIYYDLYKRLSAEVGVSDTIQFIGALHNEEIPRLLNQIDAVLVPSIWPENSPVSIMEALASGTPVLASDIGGIPELIQDGVHGYLHTYNDVASLTKNIRRLIEQPEITKKMREACLAKAREFEISKQVREIARHYDRLIENNH